MQAAYFITAIGTPLNDDETLCVAGLEAQLADQWSAGIDGIFVAGTMGMMQLLTADTYERLVDDAVTLSAGRGEVLVGVGDAGWARSRDRIRLANRYAVAGVCALTPHFRAFSQSELLDYYRALAEESRAPLYLYDLPQVAGVKLAMDTVLALAEHPNIAGIKASCEFTFTRQLIDLAPPDFRIIVAQPILMDMLIRSGVRNHLDGMWAIAPRWTVAVGQSAQRGDWHAAGRYTRQVSELKGLLQEFGFGAFTTLMNARGIPGRFAPRPYKALSESAAADLLTRPIVRQLLAEDPAR